MPEHYHFGDPLKDLVKIHTYLQRHEAEMMKDLLLQNGIESMIIADDFGGLRPGLIKGTGRIKLFVHKDEEDEALKIIEDFGIFENDDET